MILETWEKNLWLKSKGCNQKGKIKLENFKNTIYDSFVLELWY